MGYGAASGATAGARAVRGRASQEAAAGVQGGAKEEELEVGGWGV